MLLAASLVLIFASIMLVAGQLIPPLCDRLYFLQNKKADEAEKQLDKMFIQVKKEKIIYLYTLSPLIAGGIAFVVFHNLLVSLITVAASFLIPKIIIKNIESQRKAKFHSQLVDTLSVLNSSLKGGLSLLQAFEVIVEDMPAPMSQEIGLMIRENKIGIPLEESLKHLSQRMNIEDLNLVINAILIARETGGDLIKVFSRLAVTMRDSYKLNDSIKTLTLQGRLQGIIMSLLPFLFIGWVITFNKQHFEIMMKSDLGRILLFAAVILQIIGTVLIKKFSSIKL